MRIEDDIRVTDGDPENLTESVAADAEGIETLMAEAAAERGKP